VKRDQESGQHVFPLNFRTSCRDARCALRTFDSNLARLLKFNPWPFSPPHLCGAFFEGGFGQTDYDIVIALDTLDALSLIEPADQVCRMHDRLARLEGRAGVFLPLAD